MSRRDLTSAFNLYPNQINGWIETSGGGAWTIDASFNVTSVTDTGAGNMTVNWTRALPSANYVVTALAEASAVDLFVSGRTKTTTTTNLFFLTVADAATDPTEGMSAMVVSGYPGVG